MYLFRIMYEFSKKEDVQDVMETRRGPNNDYTKGWKHYRTACVICGLIDKYRVKSFIEVGACGCQLSEIVLIEFSDVYVHSIDICFKDNQEQGMLISAPIDRMKEQYGDRYKAMQKPSPQAARNFVDESIDLIYLDAHHECDGVLGDITAWWPKVSRNGILSGHDYGYIKDVTKAVNKVFKQVETGDYYNWWVVKSNLDVSITPTRHFN